MEALRLVSGRLLQISTCCRRIWQATGPRERAQNVRQVLGRPFTLREDYQAHVAFLRSSSWPSGRLAAAPDPEELQKGSGSSEAIRCELTTDQSGAGV